MAIPAKNISREYPMPAYNYRVNIGRHSIACTEVSGLTQEFEKVVYKNGLSFLGGYHILRGMPNPVTVTLKRGIIKGDKILYEMMAGEGIDLVFRELEQEITIDLCGPDGSAQVRWKVQGAVPLKLEGPSFNASSNEIALETIEFTGQRLSIEYLS